MEQPPPAHFARVVQSIEIRSKALSDVPRFPYFFGRVNRHVYDLWRADDVRPWHESPVAAVVRILPIVTHHEIVIRWNRNRGAIFHRIRRLVAVGLVERFPIYVHDALPDINRIAWQADGSLDEVWIPGQRRAEYDNLLPFWIAP